MSASAHGESIDTQSAPHGLTGERRYPGTCAHLNSAQRSERGRTRPPALRVRMGAEPVEIRDRVIGPIRQRVDREVGDVLVRRSDGLYAYQLAVVVDDAADGVTDVVRGADLALSTPRQAILAELLGLSRPAYAHVPLMLGDDGQRLAKRNGARSLAELREDGVRPAEVVGQLAASAGLIETPEPLQPVDLLSRRYSRTVAAGMRFPSDTPAMMTNPPTASSGATLSPRIAAATSTPTNGCRYM